MQSPNTEKWEQVNDKELVKYKKYKALTWVQHENIPKGVKILTTTLVMKKKVNGAYRAKVNIRGY